MKTIAIFALFFVAVNSSFLRQLTTSIDEVTFDSTCAVHPATTAVTMTLKVGTAVTTTGTFKSIISSSENVTIESECTLVSSDNTSKTFTCSVDPTGKAVGIYSLKSLTETAATPSVPDTPATVTTEGDDVTEFEVGSGVTATFTIAESIDLAAEYHIDHGGLKGSQQILFALVTASCKDTLGELRNILLTAQLSE